MRIDVVTLFPAMFDGPLGDSIVGRARAAGRLELGFVDPRDFTEDRHRTVDDRPFGGGPGMVMLAEPLARAVASVRRAGSVVALMTPAGVPYRQAEAKRLAGLEHLVVVCGRYEGVDERFIEECVDLRISLGDFVLTGGEIPAMAVIDSIARLLPGVLKKPEATELESFAEGLLEAPQYTRPREWNGRAVPEPLLDGNHADIEAWRRRKSEEMTRKFRPDLLK